MLEFVVHALFILLLAAIIAWLMIYRRLNPEDLSSSPYYRWHQLLIFLIALLAILVALIVVFASDPGLPEDFIYEP